MGFPKNLMPVYPDPQCRQGGENTSSRVVREIFYREVGEALAQAAQRAPSMEEFKVGLAGALSTLM